MVLFAVIIATLLANIKGLSWAEVVDTVRRFYAGHEGGFLIIQPYADQMVSCMHKLRSNCGDQMLQKIFYDTGEVNKKCCRNLVLDVGKDCHDSMTSYV